MTPMRLPSRVVARCSRFDRELGFGEQQRHRAAQFVVVDTHELVDVALAQRERVRHRIRRAEAVGDRCDALDLLRRTFGEAAMHAVRAVRLDAVDLAAWLQLLDRARDAGAEPAAADRDEDRVELAGLAQELVTEARRAERRARPFERMHERASLVASQLFCHRERARDVGADDNLAAEFTAGLDAQRVGGLRHRDLGGRAERLGCVGDRHGVVAGADRAHSACEHVGRQFLHDAQGPARLERPGVLEQFQLQRDLRGGGDEGAHPVAFELPDRRLTDPRLELPVGPLDRGDVRRGVGGGLGSAHRRDAAVSPPQPPAPGATDGTNGSPSRAAAGGSTASPRRTD